MPVGTQALLLSWNCFTMDKFPIREKDQTDDSIMADSLRWCLSLIRSIEKDPVLKLIMEKKITPDGWTGTEALSLPQFLSVLQVTDKRLVKAGNALQSAYDAERNKEIAQLVSLTRSRLGVRPRRTAAPAAADGEAEKIVDTPNFMDALKEVRADLKTIKEEISDSLKFAESETYRNFVSSIYRVCVSTLTSECLKVVDGTLKMYDSIHEDLQNKRFDFHDFMKTFFRIIFAREDNIKRLKEFKKLAYLVPTLMNLSMGAVCEIEVELPLHLAELFFTMASVEPSQNIDLMYMHLSEAITEKAYHAKHNKEAGFNSLSTLAYDFESLIREKRDALQAEQQKVKKAKFVTFANGLCNEFFNSLVDQDLISSGRFSTYESLFRGVIKYETFENFYLDENESASTRTTPALEDFVPIFRKTYLHNLVDQVDHPGLYDKLQVSNSSSSSSYATFGKPRTRGHLSGYDQKEKDKDLPCALWVDNGQCSCQNKKTDGHHPKDLKSTGVMYRTFYFPPSWDPYMNRVHKKSNKWKGKVFRPRSYGKDDNNKKSKPTENEGTSSSFATTAKKKVRFVPQKIHPDYNPTRRQRENGQLDECEKEERPWHGDGSSVLCDYCAHNHETKYCPLTDDGEKNAKEDRISFKTVYNKNGPPAPNQTAPRKANYTSKSLPKQDSDDNKKSSKGGNRGRGRGPNRRRQRNNRQQHNTSMIFGFKKSFVTRSQNAFAILNTSSSDEECCNTALAQAVGSHESADRGF